MNGEVQEPEKDENTLSLIEKIFLVLIVALFVILMVAAWIEISKDILHYYKTPADKEVVVSCPDISMRDGKESFYGPAAQKVVPARLVNRYGVFTDTVNPHFSHAFLLRGHRRCWLKK